MQVQVENVRVGGGVANREDSPIAPGGTIRISLTGPRLNRVAVEVGAERARILRREWKESPQVLSVRVPATAPEGCYVPVRLWAGGAMLPDSLPLAISRMPACKPPRYQPSDAWLSGRTGVAVRIHGKEWSLENAAATTTVDVAAGFLDGNASSFRPGALLRFPPAGHCSSRHGSYVRGTPTLETLLPLLFENVNGGELHAGESVGLDDGRYQMRIPLVVGHSGLYWRNVFSSQQLSQELDTSRTLYMRAGQSGQEVTPLVAPLAPPQPFEWVNRPVSPAIRLIRDVRVEWNGGAGGVVLVAAATVNPETARFGYCLCLAPAEASRFDMPRELLRSLAVAVGGGDAGGALYLIHIPEGLSDLGSTQFSTSAALRLSVVSGKVLFRLR